MPEHSHGKILALGRALHAVEESLHEHSVQAIFLHPSEMSVNGAFIIRTEELRRFSANVSESRRVSLAVLADIRPGINVSPCGVREHHLFLRIVEPSLIAGHHKPFVRRISRFLQVFALCAERHGDKKRQCDCYQIMFHYD